MRRHTAPHVRGPYREGSGKWRIVVIKGGQQSARIYAQKGHAKRAMKALFASWADEVPLTPQVQRWCDAMTARGISEHTVRYRRVLLLQMFDGETASMWTVKRAEKSLALWAEIGLAVATRRVYLWIVRSFWKATQKTDIWPSKIEGRARTGKQQLRIEEARRLIAVCMATYESGQSIAAAFVVMLAMGLRSSEITRRVVRDVDDDASVLWIPFGKTERSRRTLEIPRELQPLFRDLMRGKADSDFLLGVNSVGKPWGSSALWQMLGWFCKRAGIPRVCPHSLRGLWASLAIRGGASPTTVAAALGHTSFAMTTKHYIASGVAESAQSRVAVSRLFPSFPADKTSASTEI